MTALESEVVRCRERFIRWVEWYLKSFAHETPSQAELARKIGISPSAVNQWLAQGSDRAPRFEALVGFRRLTGIPLDALLYSEPPGAKPPR